MSKLDLRSYAGAEHADAAWLHKNTNLDKASFLSTKQKEKELALEKAQVAESSLEELVVIVIAIWQSCNQYS